MKQPAPDDPVSKKGPSRLFHLDVVRGVALLLVLGHHTPAVIRIHPILDSLSDAVHDMGYLGVDLFFVLSGFLIGGLLFAEMDRTGNIRVGRFLARRAFKIWPAYLICLVVTSLGLATFSKDLASDPQPYKTITLCMWPAALHVQNYFPSTGFCFWFWSLGVEEHFYLLLPGVLVLVCLPAGRTHGVLHRVLLLAVLTAITCLALRAVTVARHPEYDGYTHWFPTHLRIDSLMAGVALVALTRYAPGFIARLRPWRWVLLVAGVAIFILPALFPGIHPKLFPYLYPYDCTLMWLAGMTIVLFAHYADQFPGSTLNGLWLQIVLKPVAYVGIFSYSIYLWHGFFAAPISARLMALLGLPLFNAGTTTLVHLGLYLMVAVAMGIASFYVIELPFLALRERLAPKRVASKDGGSG